MDAREYAGKPAPDALLDDIPRLQAAYYSQHPDPANPAQRVAFGTSGHRGSSRRGSFNEDHILAVAQAICSYRAKAGIRGPLFLGRDTHALSGPAQQTALEVLAANGVEVRLAAADGYTPTPVISHAILGWNRCRPAALADGIVITPSHNPPGDGGIKYNPPHGGPADTDITSVIQAEANRLLEAGLNGVRRLGYDRALKASTTQAIDFIGPYVEDLPNVVDVAAIRAAGLRLGADALGGAGLAYWDAIAARHGLTITALNATPDPTFRFMHVDHDGKIRMDCSSPAAMAGLIKLKDHFDLAFGNDPDFDRHGIVTPTAGLMNPNHYLAVVVAYLFAHRPAWARRPGWAGPWSPVRCSTGWPPASVVGSSRCPWASNGSWMASSLPALASAARKAPGRRFCVGTGRCGRRTRTASSWRCWRRRSPRSLAAIRPSTTTN